MKVCSNPRCPFKGEPQPLTSFYAHKKTMDRLQYWCKTCTKSHNNTDEAKAKRRECSLAYSRTAEGKKKRKEYASSDEGHLAQAKANENYYGSEKDKQRQKRARENNPNHAAARSAVLGAVLAKKILPANALTCANCGNPAKHYHHHKGYTPEYWLEVIPLCLDCHTEAHLSIT